MGHRTARGLAKSVIKLVIVAAIFYFLYRTGRLDLSALAEVFGRVDFFAPVLSLFLVGYLFQVKRWVVLLAAQDIVIPFSTAFKLTMIGTFFNLTIPGSVSGDIVKAYYLAKGQRRKTALVTTILFDRLLGLYAMMAVGLFAGMIMFSRAWITGQSLAGWSPHIKALMLFVIAFFTGMTVVGAAFMSERLNKSRLTVVLLTRLPFHETVVKIYNTIHRFGRKPRDAATAFFYSLLSQLAWYVALWFVADALGVTELSKAQYVFALPVCFLINAIPLAPAGLGIGELGFGAVFALFGSDMGDELALVYHAIVFIYGLGLGGIIYLLSDMRVNVSEIREGGQ